MDVRETASVIGPGARFKGELVVDGVLRVLGAFDGTLQAGEVQIGPGAHTTCTIEAGTVIVDGTHQGDIVARECVQLTSKASVQGDVTALELAVAQGASFVGRCVVGPNALGQRPAPERAPAPDLKVVTRKVRSGDWMEPAAAQAGDWLAAAVPPSR